MTTPPDPQAPPAAPPASDPVGPRLDRIEATLAALHPAAQAHTERRLERPQRIEEQVEAALRQAEKDRKAEADAADLAKFRTDTAAAIKELKETRPGQAAARGVEKLMGWA